MPGRFRTYALFTLLLSFPAVLVLVPVQRSCADPVAVAVEVSPRGVEVLARGPIHEAFASLTLDPQPTRPIPKRPPTLLEELPPEEKPEGEVVWIGGYWAWDDDRNDFLWVSGTWRTPPPHKRWVAGYWRETGEQWQWVPGFWAAIEREEAAHEVTYLPAPPATPELAPPGAPPVADSFYVPGNWLWTGRSYGWRAGYWARIQPGHVWVSSHYRWSPTGYIYVAGYWDLAVSSRGVLFAPIIVDPLRVERTFVYTPTYVVRDTVVVDSLFVRPSTCHYYFGDYYGASYSKLGFEASIVYSRRRYDPVIVYERYERRADPRWEGIQFNLVIARNEGRAPVPPRTLIQQNTIIQKNVTNVTNVRNVKNVTNVTNVTNVQNTEVLTTVSKSSKEKGVRTVALDQTARQQVRQQSAAVNQGTQQRAREEKSLATSGPLTQPRKASFTAPAPKPVYAAKEPRPAPAPPVKPAPPQVKPVPPQVKLAPPQVKPAPPQVKPAPPQVKPVSPAPAVKPAPPPARPAPMPPQKFGPAPMPAPAPMPRTSPPPPPPTPRPKVKPAPPKKEEEKKKKK